VHRYARGNRLCRGLRPHYVWEGKRRNLGDLASPKPLRRGPGHDGKPRRRSRRGRGEESDGRIVPGKPRTKPTTNRWRRWWREGGRPEGRRAATHAPDSVPDVACKPKSQACGSGVHGPPSPDLDRVSTFGRSPVRESRTPGSARGAGATRSPTATERLRTKSIL